MTPVPLWGQSVSDFSSSKTEAKDQVKEGEMTLFVDYISPQHSIV